MIESQQSENLDIDTQTEIEVDAAVDTSEGAKVHEKQLISEQADSSEDNTSDINL